MALIGNIPEALKQFGFSASKLAAVTLIGAGGAGGFYAHKYMSDDVISAHVQHLASSRESLDLARANAAGFKAEAADLHAKLSQSDALLRMSDRGDVAATLRGRLDKAEADLSAMMIERDRLADALASKEGERKQCQQSKEQTNADFASFRSVAMATLGQRGMQAEISLLKKEADELTKRSLELAIPSSNFSAESRAAQLDILEKDIAFKHKLIENLTLRCKQ